MVEYVKLMCVTANVGSVFDYSDNIVTHWLHEVGRSIADVKADFVALHLQQTGGKKLYEEGAKLNSEQLVRKLLDTPTFEDYGAVHAFFDEDVGNKDKFTGLGSVYFLRNPEKIKIWDYKRNDWTDASRDEFLGGDLKDVHVVRKETLPKEFHKEKQYIRKGFMRTRFQISEQPMNFVNLHLFNDHSNISAATKDPNPYAVHRAGALRHIFERLSPEITQEPTFLFGDFNFRLDQPRLLSEFARVRDAVAHEQTDGVDDTIKRIDYLAFGSGSRTATVEQKRFDLYDMHEWMFNTCNGQLVRKYNREVQNFNATFPHHTLHEPNIPFAPTYPFEHTERRAIAYNYDRKRCPAWPDRVLMNDAAWASFKHDSFSSSSVIYNSIGQDDTVGEHKPVFLYASFAVPKHPHHYDAHDGDVHELEHDDVGHL